MKYKVNRPFSFYADEKKKKIISLYVGNIVEDVIFHSKQFIETLIKNRKLISINGDIDIIGQTTNVVPGAGIVEKEYPMRQRLDEKSVNENIETNLSKKPKNMEVNEDVAFDLDVKKGPKKGKKKVKANKNKNKDIENNVSIPHEDMGLEYPPEPIDIKQVSENKDANSDINLEG